MIQKKSTLHTPHSTFLFGSSTSAHQVEGGNTNDWSEWERANAERLSRESSGAYPPENYISGKAVDHYHKYEEDFDIAKSLGHNAHRFSIEWSRIESTQGTYNAEEVAHYQGVVRALVSRGIEPVVTLYHWTQPLWFRDQGGWLHRDAHKQFARFAEHMAKALPEVTYWCTINEPEIYTSHGYIKGSWPPSEKSVWKAWRVMRALARAHRCATARIHGINAHAQVGFAINMIAFIPTHPIFMPFAWMSDLVWNRWWIRLTRGRYDWIGVNYYFAKYVGWGSRPVPVSVSDMGWPTIPEGLERVLLSCKRYRVPIMVTENGIADAHDDRRQKYIQLHLDAVKRAKKSGVNIIGYLYWSLLDNFEWDKGFWPKFGLVSVDRVTMERKVRGSAQTFVGYSKSQNPKSKM